VDAPVDGGDFCVQGQVLVSKKFETKPGETRQYTVADLERARANDYSGNLNRGRAGLKRAQQLELSVIESQLRLRDSLRDESFPTAMSVVGGKADMDGRASMSAFDPERTLTNGLLNCSAFAWV
jgi:hypothetical protein